MLSDVDLLVKVFATAAVCINQSINQSIIKCSTFRLFLVIPKLGAKILQIRLYAQLLLIIFVLGMAFIALTFAN